MERCGNRDTDSCPQLLDLIPKDKKNELLEKEEEQGGYYGSLEDRKLELRLGPPGEEEDWGFVNGTRSTSINNLEATVESSRLSLTHIPYNKNHITPCGSKRGFAETWMMKKNKETQPCSSKMLDLHSSQKKELSPVSADTAVCNSSQKRNAPAAAVVGWPPVRSFRKNLSGISLSSRTASEREEKARLNKIPPSDKPAVSCRSSSFVKINMDGVPIGRKVNLKAYNSYGKLSSAVDVLFRDLLTAQRDFPGDGMDEKQVEEKAILGSGEYALVYEDSEGDRVLVGDVPWQMFVSTARRLRVMKSSEISTLRSSSKQEKSAFAPCCPKNEEE